MGRVPPALAALVALAFLILAAPRAIADGPSIETELLELVNGARSRALPVHTGLLAAGRLHSQEMAAKGKLNHNGAGKRIRDAAPDPAEANGAPDDGFTGTWCENTGYVQDLYDMLSDREIAQKIYEGWRESQSHNRCMTHAKMTAAGIGVYYQTDEHIWWITMEAMEDETPPGSTTTTVQTPTPFPEVSEEIVTPPADQPPQPIDAPTKKRLDRAYALASVITPAPSVAPRLNTDSRIGPQPLAAPSIRSPHEARAVGWPKTAALIAVAVAAVFVHREFVRWRGR